MIASKTHRMAVFALLAGTLSGCPIDDEPSQADETSWSWEPRAGSAAPPYVPEDREPNPPATAPSPTPGVDTNLYFKMRGTYAFAGGVNSLDQGNNQVNSVVMNQRYTFGLLRDWSTCTRHQIGSEVGYTRDSGSFTLLPGAIELSGSERNDRTMRFEYEYSSGDIRLNGNRFRKVLDGELCE
jgi:hypothetical protein